jgi:hypothetical protein
MDRVCSTDGNEEECIQRFGGKSRRKEPLRRPKHSWEKKHNRSEMVAVIGPYEAPPTIYIYI